LRHLITILVTGFLAIAGLFAAYATFRVLQPEAQAGMVEIRIGSAILRLNRAYIRAPDVANGGRIEQLDLAIHHPSFRPLSLMSERGPDTTLNVRISPKDDSLDPSERPAKLYARFLEVDQWSHPGGLLMRRFEPGSPYEREELYIAPPEGRLFSARCQRPAQPPDGLPNTCISEIRLRGLDVQLRYPPELLPEWEHLIAGTRGLIESVVQ
jgi:hypothetical protein